MAHGLQTGAQGHPAGLNAALARMLYFPPALPPADPVFQLTVERVIQRDIATPEELYLVCILFRVVRDFEVEVTVEVFICI